MEESFIAKRMVWDLWDIAVEYYLCKVCSKYRGWAVKAQQAVQTTLSSPGKELGPSDWGKTTEEQELLQ